MATKTYYNTGEPRLIFGMGGVHPLPDGWRLVASPKDWLMATDPDGQEYYLSETHAYPRRVAKVAVGGLKLGDPYADTMYGIVELPPSATS